MASRHARKRAKCDDQTIDPIVGSTEQMVVHSTVGQTVEQTVGPFLGGGQPPPPGGTPAGHATAPLDAPAR